MHARVRAEPTRIYSSALLVAVCVRARTTEDRRDILSPAHAPRPSRRLSRRHQCHTDFHSPVFGQIIPDGSCQFAVTPDRGCRPHEINADHLSERTCMHVCARSHTHTRARARVQFRIAKMPTLGSCFQGMRIPPSPLPPPVFSLTFVVL